MLRKGNGIGALSALLTGVTIAFFGASAVAQNLVTNGDFSSTSPLGFSSNYSQDAALDNSNAKRRRFNVASVPSASSSWSGACASQTGTPGSGNALLANGHTSADQALWYQTLSWTAGTLYAWSLKAASLSAANPAKLRVVTTTTLNVLVDTLSTASGTVTTLSTTPCAWQTLEGTYKPSAGGNNVLRIIDDDTSQPGNDFMIDDITLKAVTVSTSVSGPSTLLVGATGSYSLTIANTTGMTLTSPTGLTIGIGLPAAFNGGAVPFTCTGLGGATCGADSGTINVFPGSFGGNVLPAGGAIRIDLTATAQAAGSGSISAWLDNSALAASTAVTVSAPAGASSFTVALANAGLTCAPATVTVNAVGGTPANGAQTTIAVHFSGDTAAHGNFACPAGGCSGFTLAPGAADGGTATITWNGSATTATFEYRNTWAETVKVRATTASPSATGETALTAFAHAGLRFTDSGGTTNSPFSTLTAGTASGTLYVQAVQSTVCSGGSCTGSCAASPYYSGARSLDFQLNCANPTTCASGNVTVNATTFGAGSGASSAWSPVTLTFGTNGTLAASAPITVNYADAGQVTLGVRDTGTPGSPSATSNAFVVRPADLRVTSVTRTSDSFANPAAADANGTVFARAGESITVTVQAQNSAGAATANFGRETSPPTVALATAMVAPVGGNNPALSGTLGTFSGGSASGTFSWPEVGILRLTPSISAYLGTAGLTGTQSGNVGRFRPDRLVVSAASLATRNGTNASGTFTYFGEDARLALTLTAKAADGTTTTQNYTGTFAKFSPLAANFDVGARDTGTATSLTGRLGAISVTGGAMASGTGSYTLTLPIMHPGTTPEGPYDTVKIGVAPADSDGVTLNSAAFDFSSTGGANNRKQIGGDTRIRYGRLRLLAGGAQPVLNPIPLTVQAQYWNTGASNWAVNDYDDQTVIPPAAFGMGSFAGNLAAGETLLASNLGMAPANVTMAAGIATFRLSAPGAGNAGSLGLTLVRNTPSVASTVHLQGGGGASTTTLGAGLTWDQSTAVDPVVTAQWSSGARLAKQRFHMRENR